MASKKTMTPKTVKSKQSINPAMLEIDEESFAQPIISQPEQQKSEPRRMATSQERSPLNHLTASSTSEEIGGMKFSRARAGLDHSGKMALDIPKEYLNDELRYRWVNETSGRTEKLREIGYETVDQASFSKGEKITTRRRVGTNKDGSALYAILMATPKKWYDERQALAENDRTNKERGLITGKIDGSGEELGKEFYNKGSKIQR